MKLYFDDIGFDGQLQRSVGKADSGMANVGECLTIAEQIAPGDRGSWYRAWSQFGAGLLERGDEAAKAGHPVSARGKYLRAAEYFRQAFFFHRDDLDSVEVRNGYSSSVRAFRSALHNFDHHGRILAGAASGYLFSPHPAGKRPTIMHIGGYDGTAEELYASAAPALDRGYAFAALDGPGQGGVLYDRRVPMRPDWENVVPAMVDAVCALPEVDPEQIVLVGRSFGGLIGPRGASGEKRLAALIVDPGAWEVGSVLVSRLGPLADRMNDTAAEAEFDALLQDPALRAFLAPRMATHGLSSVRAYCADLQRYTNSGTVGRITCPTFVADNESDPVSPGQGRILFDHLSCPKEFRMFTTAEGAGGHCEGMAPTVFWDAAYDWLDARLAL